MFEQVLKEEYRKYYSEARLRKQEADYISNVAQQYLRPAIKIFAKNEKDRIKLEKKVFEGVKNTIREVEEGYGVFIGIPLVNCIDKSPQARLGWVYNTRPTKEGFKIVDGLREIRGYSPLKESRQKIRDRIFKRFTSQ